MSKLSKTDIRGNLKRPLFWVSMIALSAVFAICVETYWIIGRVSLEAGNFDAVFHPQIWQIAVCFIIGMIIFPFMYVYWDNMKSLLWKYRYLWAIIVLFLCVVFEISGSSIGMWGKVLPSEDGVINDGVLFGMPRDIRTDEWAVNTPMNFSQYFNHTGKFNYFSETIRGTATDSFVVASQPVLSFVAIFRPFYWGYFLFNPARGLSFFWCARIISLFMVTLDFSMLLTKKNKVLSVFAAILISFSPAVQWWFSAGGLVDIIVFGLLAVLLINKYMQTVSYKIRILLALLLVFCAGSFALTLYPAWEIPMAYVVLSLCIAIIIKNWKNFAFSLKKDLPIIIFSILILCVSMMYVLLKSSDTISLISNTAYPGARFELGGHTFNNLFQYITNLRLPFTTKNIPMNQCELSTFFDFAPIGVVLAVIVIIKKRGKDVFLNCMVLCQLFFSYYTIVGFPEFFSKVTLMSNCQPNRIVTIIGFLNILILARAMSQFDFEIKVWQKHLIAMICVLFVISINLTVYGEYLTKAFLIAILLILTIMYITILSSNKRKNQIILTAIVAFIIGGTGLLVNPIQRGANEVFENKLYTSIKNIADSSNDKWLTNDINNLLINLPIMAGAPTINSTNAYPSLETWNKIDQEQKYVDIYNRYAHINVSIQTNSNSSFELEAADAIKLKLNVDDIEKLDVGYILSTTPLEQLSNNNVYFKLIETVMQYKIYEVVYK